MEEKKEEVKQEVTQQPEHDPNLDLILKANAAAERLEKANKQMAELLTKQALMKAEQIIGGQANAGSKQDTEEDKDIKAARALLAGTGLDDYAFPEK
jgi:hypothetical protein